MGSYAVNWASFSRLEMHAVSDQPTRDLLTAPGVPLEPSDRDRAIAIARIVLREHAFANVVEAEILARQFLRAIGVSEKD